MIINNSASNRFMNPEKDVVFVDLVGTMVSVDNKTSFDDDGLTVFLDAQREAGRSLVMATAESVATITNSLTRSISSRFDRILSGNDLWGEEIYYYRREGRGTIARVRQDFTYSGHSENPNHRFEYFSVGEFRSAFMHNIKPGQDVPEMTTYDGLHLTSDMMVRPNQEWPQGSFVPKSYYLAAAHIRGRNPEKVRAIGIEDNPDVVSRLCETLPTLPFVMVHPTGEWLTRNRCAGAIDGLLCDAQLHPHKVYDTLFQQGAKIESHTSEFAGGNAQSEMSLVRINGELFKLERNIDKEGIILARGVWEKPQGNG